MPFKSKLSTLSRKIRGSRKEKSKIVTRSSSNLKKSPKKGLKIIKPNYNSVCIPLNSLITSEYVHSFIENVIQAVIKPSKTTKYLDSFIKTNLNDCLKRVNNSTDVQNILKLYDVVSLKEYQHSQKYEEQKKILQELMSVNKNTSIPITTKSKTTKSNKKKSSNYKSTRKLLPRFNNPIQGTLITQSAGANLNVDSSIMGIGLMLCVILFLLQNYFYGKQYNNPTALPTPISQSALKSTYDSQLYSQLYSPTSFTMNKIHNRVFKLNNNNVTKISSDKRRQILRIIFNKNGKPINVVIKISNNEVYVEGYKIEASVYYYLNKKKARDFLKIYGFGYTFISELDRMKFVPINIMSPNKSTIVIPFKWKMAQDSYMRQSYYYSLLEFNENYKTLEEYMMYNDEEDISNAVQLICNSIGNLNSSYGFYHGDLKVDNVMLELGKSGNILSIKNFDFDFSGILGVVECDNLANLKNVYFSNSLPNIIDNLFADQNNPRLKNFVFVFDIYRLWCGIMLKKTFDDTLNNLLGEIKTQNGTGIKFKLSDFTEYFKLTWPSTNSFDEILGNNWNWNTALMNANIFVPLFEYIEKNNLGPVTRGPHRPNNDNDDGYDGYDANDVLGSPKRTRRSMLL